jgi:hypothetical protein
VPPLTSATKISQSSGYNAFVLLRRVYIRAITSTNETTASVQTGAKYVAAMLEYGGIAIIPAMALYCCESAGYVPM